MKRIESKIGKDEIEIYVVGLAASGKSTIAIMVADFLKGKGLNANNLADFESEVDIRNQHSKLKEKAVIDKIKNITIREITANRTLKDNG